jgi:hypothetical protein
MFSQKVGNKLRTYILFKEVFETEMYLSKNIPSRYRSAFAKFKAYSFIYILVFIATCFYSQRSHTTPKFSKGTSVSTWNVLGLLEMPLIKRKIGVSEL